MVAWGRLEFGLGWGWLHAGAKLIGQPRRVGWWGNVGKGGRVGGGRRGHIECKSLSKLEQ